MSELTSGNISKTGLNSLTPVHYQQQKPNKKVIYIQKKSKFVMEFISDKWPILFNYSLYIYNIESLNKISAKREKKSKTLPKTCQTV